MGVGSGGQTPRRRMTNRVQGRAKEETGGARVDEMEGGANKRDPSHSHDDDP